jgi:hypothetical protein
MQATQGLETILLCMHVRSSKPYLQGLVFVFAADIQDRWLTMAKLFVPADSDPIGACSLEAWNCFCGLHSRFPLSVPEPAMAAERSHECLGVGEKPMGQGKSRGSLLQLSLFVSLCGDSQFDMHCPCQRESTAWNELAGRVVRRNIGTYKWPKIDDPNL